MGCPFTSLFLPFQVLECLCVYHWAEGLGKVAEWSLLAGCHQSAKLLLVILWFQVICVDGEHVFLGCWSPVSHICSDEAPSERVVVCSFHYLQEPAHQSLQMGCGLGQLAAVHATSWLLSPCLTSVTIMWSHRNFHSFFHDI